MTTPSALSPQHAAEADLAYLRAIVEGDGRPRLTLAVAYLAGGLLYGLQCLFHLGQATGVIRWPDLANLSFVVGISVAFMVVLSWAIRRDRRDQAANVGPAANRAMHAALNGAGMVNVAAIIVFGVGAARDQDLALWLYYPAMVFGLQSAAWIMAWSLKRKGWMLATALGGWGAAVALGLLVREPLAYLLVCTAALFALFAAPGWIMFRDARRTGREA
ncbi:hypothetical protein E4M02_04500 [Brevundimonas sp. S30B]|uniref:hypothetical protein n=1 Tax=unclassified Brevundimonas TaxID=2622653 RepID=UPI0010724D38|nr:MULTISPECIES: hypothetical protein [unclassified Brevundimonas]QBX36870.1 hypothetical protein E4M01_03315 [Brevundimonas sp. MF30-B]TFW04335.1 hypothetical protein E4M02_04500 [Brevundimonas sp. S30B]